MKSICRPDRRLVGVLALVSVTSCLAGPIDRQALVTRHNPSVSSVDPWSPFTVGNGGFATTVDVTGLQTFPDAYRDGLPLSTLSDWGWHAFPNPEGFRLEDTLETFRTEERPVPYPTNAESPAGQWLRANPHRLGLGRIGFRFRLADGSLATPDDLGEIDQVLELWHGLIRSSYTVAGTPVRVVTAAFPQGWGDGFTVEVESPLMASGQLSIRVDFPYGSGAWGMEPEDWQQPGRHSTRLEAEGPGRVTVQRKIDNLGYRVRILADGADIRQTGPHRIDIAPGPDSRRFSFVFIHEDAPGDTMGPQATRRPRLGTSGEASGARGGVPSSPAVEQDRFLPEAEEGKQDSLNAISGSKRFWPAFWSEGAAVGFGGSSDPRATELERRVVLSQYLTAVQCAGDMPPQETGLTFNSWFGVAHLEMHWWHGVHFALWDRMYLLAGGAGPGGSQWPGSLDWYRRIQPVARGIARRQGYDGFRWPKMVDRDGTERPSAIAPLLIWQQPHPIYFAELLWRLHPGSETLNAWKTVVLESAAFMADFPVWNEQQGQLDLGPPLIPAQESYDPRTTSNPPLELAYWRWGLETAQAWRTRLGMPRDEDWDRILERLAPFPLFEDVYATAEGSWNTVDHPSVLGAFGMLPGSGIEPERMRRTLHRVLAEQDWESTWGWDYPLIAMTAARLGEPELAVDALLMDRPKNRYLNNGHNFQTENLRVYLPGNGALLTAVAMMAAGWVGAPERDAPGFPANGHWSVEAEGFRQLP